MMQTCALKSERLPASRHGGPLPAAARVRRQRWAERLRSSPRPPHWIRHHSGRGQGREALQLTLEAARNSETCQHPPGSTSAPAGTQVRLQLDTDGQIMLAENISATMQPSFDSNRNRADGGEP